LFDFGIEKDGYQIPSHAGALCWGDSTVLKYVATAVVNV